MFQSAKAHSSVYLILLTSTIFPTEENVVRIETNQLLDWLSTQTYLAVTNEFDRRIKAHFSLTADGRAIIVRMDEFAVESRRFLRVHPNLEDVAGNRADMPFELSVNAVKKH